MVLKLLSANSQSWMVLLNGWDSPGNYQSLFDKQQIILLQKVFVCVIFWREFISNEKFLMIRDKRSHA